MSRGSVGVASTTATADNRLGQFRSELDLVDAELLQILRRRFEICSRVAELKRDESIPMMQPDRIGIVQRRARQFAEDNQLRPSFVHALYELIIGEACYLEDAIIAASGAEAQA